MKTLRSQIENALKNVIIDTGYIRSRYAVIDTMMDVSMKSFNSFDEAVADFTVIKSQNPGRDLAITGWNHGILATARDVSDLFTPASGTFECPICGISSPHQHDGNDVREYTEHQSFLQETYEKRRKEILGRVDRIEASYGKTPKLDKAVSEIFELLEAQLAGAEAEITAIKQGLHRASLDNESLKNDTERYQWQPIETAPSEDGARVLLFGYASTYGGGADFKQPIVRCGRRENNTFSRMVKVEGSNLFRSEDYLSVRWVDDQTYLTDDRLLPPTHWMSLPSPPEILK